MQIVVIRRWNRMAAELPILRCGRISLRGVCIVLSLLSSQVASAQITVQQPVVSTTSVNTTASVPDRGSAFLGGVSSGQSGRSQYGSFRSGTSKGLSRQASSMSVSVYIHDLQSMDEALLNSGSSDPNRIEAPAYGLSNLPRSREPVAVSDVTPAEKIAKFEQLARKAEEAGKPGVAKLHWQVAAKYGSKAAETRLAELSPSKPPSFPVATKTAAR